MPPKATPSAPNWDFVKTDNTCTIIPSQKYFKDIGILVGERKESVEKKEEQTPVEIVINLNGNASIEMMALFILDILHDNSSARGGKGIEGYFTKQLATECGSTPFYCMVSHILYGVLNRPQLLLYSTFLQNYDSIIVEIIKKCHSLSASKRAQNLFPAIDEKAMLKTITHNAMEGCAKTRFIGNATLRDNKLCVFSLSAKEASPHLKPLELMLDQGQSIVMSLLGTFPALHISTINRMDMGDSYRTALHLGPAILALTSQGPPRKCSSNEITPEVLNEARKFISGSSATSSLAEGYTDAIMARANIICKIYKSIAYVTTYYDDKKTGTSVRPTRILHQFIKDYVKITIVVLGDALKLGKIKYRDGIEHAFILFIEEEIVIPLEAVYKELGIAQPPPPVGLSRKTTVAAPRISLLPIAQVPIIETLKNISHEDDALLLKDLLRMQTQPPPTVEELITKAFQHFKKRAIDDAIVKNYIVHTRPVNITINMTFKEESVVFFRAKYSVNENKCAQMILNHRTFKSTFSAAEVGKWIKDNENNPDAMKTDLTLACLAKYVGDLNQFIYGFYMGIVVASEDASAIANAVFLMNYLSSDEGRLKDFKRGGFTQMGGAPPRESKPLPPIKSRAQRIASQQTAQREQLIETRRQLGMVPEIVTAMPTAMATEMPIELAHNADLDERTVRGMIIATTVSRGHGFYIRYIANYNGAQYITSELLPRSDKLSYSTKLQRKDLRARLQSAERAFKEDELVPALKNYAKTVGADAYIPTEDNVWDTGEMEAAAGLVSIAAFPIPVPKLGTQAILGSDVERAALQARKEVAAAAKALENIKRGSEVNTSLMNTEGGAKEKEVNILGKAIHQLAIRINKAFTRNTQ